MCIDTEKTVAIIAWPKPTDKLSVKNFLQTVQLLAAFMKNKVKGQTFTDVTAPLRHFKG